VSDEFTKSVIVLPVKVLTKTWKELWSDTVDGGVRDCVIRWIVFPYKILEIWRLIGFDGLTIVIPYHFNGISSG
jgi:hypothetical protein